MNKAERFLRMAQVEDKVSELVSDGWKARRVVYDDEDGEPLHAVITLTVEGDSKLKGVL